ncbi:MAG: FAD-dependent monooxygenase [Pseudomonadota bacterium]
MDTDVIILGGGLNGCTLALALAQVGIHPTIIDALPLDRVQRNDFDGRSYAIAAANASMLRVLGLWDDLEQHAQPMMDIKVTDGRVGDGPSPFFMHFDHGEIGQGPLGYLIEDRHLRHVLLDHVVRAGIDHRPATTVIDQHDHGTSISATLMDGTTLQGRVLVGADGRASGTAQRAGLKRVSWGYGQSSLVCALDHDRPHNGVAHQFFMPAGPLAILPLTGQRSSIVWTETTKNAHRINALPDADYLNILRPRVGDFLGDIRLTGDRYTYPLGLILAHDMIRGRVALVGDSAHGVHPIAGQGLNAGLKDVAALAQVLADTKRRGQDIALALSDYQQWRRFDNATLAMATDGFNRLFSNDVPLVRAARGLGMGVINTLPRLRRGFMKEAAGLTGTRPRLLQGRPI